MEDSPLVLIERWARSLRELDTHLDAPELDLLSSIRKAQTLGKELTDRAPDLPTYEVGRCERELKKVLTKLDEKKSSPSSKPKFSFKRSTMTKPKDARSQATNPASGPTSRPSSLDRAPISLPSTSLALSHRSHEYLSSAALPPLNSSRQEALLLQDLEHCFVDLLPPPQGSLSFAHDAPHANFPALYLSGLRDCTVLLPKIQGSVMLHSCDRCLLVLGGHQVRMHDSTACYVYLDADSTPIIERCKDLVFDAYPTLFQPVSKSSVAEAKEPVFFVQDFDNPFATSETPSANWRIATEDDQAEWIRTEHQATDNLWETQEGRRRLWEQKQYERPN